MIDEEEEFEDIHSDDVAAPKQEEEEFAKIIKFGDFEDYGEKGEGHAPFYNNYEEYYVEVREED